MNGKICLAPALDAEPRFEGCADVFTGYAKEEFGKDWTKGQGGVSLRTDPALPEEVYRHCRERIEIFSKDGGFVFNQEHNILPDVPPENILAMYKAVADAH